VVAPNRLNSPQVFRMAGGKASQFRNRLDSGSDMRAQMADVAYRAWIAVGWA
jgi:hypothetical protein